MNICVDIDGTMTTGDYYIPFFNRFFNKEVSFQDMKVYDLKQVYGVSQREITEFYNLMGNKMHASAIMQPHVVETISKWQKHHKVSIVTARLKEHEHVTLKWLEENGINQIDVHSLGKSEKLEFSKTLHCDLFIEDHPMESLRLAREGIRVLLMDNPYNTEVSHFNIDRVKNWYEIDSYVKNLENC